MLDTWSTSPSCHRCGGSDCLTSYRRLDGKPEWTCAQCSGLRLSRGNPDASVRSREPNAEPAEQLFRPRQESQRPRYAGPRQRGDPMGR